MTGARYGDVQPGAGGSWASQWQEAAAGRGAWGAGAAAPEGGRQLWGTVASGTANGVCAQVAGTGQPPGDPGEPATDVLEAGGGEALQGQHRNSISKMKQRGQHHSWRPCFQALSGKEEINKEITVSFHSVSGWASPSPPPLPA